MPALSAAARYFSASSGVQRGASTPSNPTSRAILNRSSALPRSMSYKTAFFGFHSTRSPPTDSLDGRSKRLGSPDAPVASPAATGMPKPAIFINSRRLIELHIADILLNYGSGEDFNA